MTTQLAFRDTKFNITNHSDKIWLRGTEIAKALGMEKSDAVSQIYNRNSDEFTDAMTLTLKLSVNGFGNGMSAKSVRVFSLRGAHLIAMFARTEIAKEFRKWILDILDREVGSKPEVVAPTNALPSTDSPMRVLLDFIGNQIVASNNISPTAMVFEPSQIANFISEPIFSDKEVAEIAEAAVRRLGRMTR